MTSAGIPTPQTSPSQIGVEAIESGIADATYTAAFAANPGAGAAVVTTAALGAGIYEVLVEAGYLGTTAPAAAEAGNMAFQKNAANFGSGTLIVPAAIGINTFGPFRITLIATDTLRVIQVAAGTAGVNYAAAITARRVG